MSTTARASRRTVTTRSIASFRTPAPASIRTRAVPAATARNRNTIEPVPGGDDHGSIGRADHGQFRETRKAVRAR